MRCYRTLVATTMLSTTLAIATPSQAQTSATTDSPDTEQGDIVVTGIRQSLEAARDIKRETDQFVDAIVADDIGKLPDTNVAESLARVSGVQVERGVGEGSDISVRGLRENVILYNGRLIVDATGRGGNGLDQLNTGTFGLLALVPSELISRLQVTKLAGADQIAGGLGGIIDIQARKPLDDKGFHVVAKMGGVYEELSRKAGYEAFGLVSHSFDDDRLGVLLTASYSNRKLAEEGLNTFSGYTRFTSGGIARFGNSDVRAQQIAEDRTKLGLSAVVEWQPNDDVEIIADTFYSRLTTDRNRYWLSFNPSSGLTNPTFSPNNVLLTGTATTPVLTNTEFADVQSEVWSSALRTKVNLTDRLTTSFEMSYGTSLSSYNQLYFRLQPVAGVNSTVNFDLASGNFGAFQIGGIDLNDPAQLRFTILFDNKFRARTETFAARSDWSYDIESNFLKAFNFGARYSRLDSRQDPLRADIRPAGGLVASSLGNFVTSFSNPRFLQGDFAGLPRTYLVASSALTGCAALPSTAQNVQCLSPATTVAALSSTFRIKEDFGEAYTRLDIDSDLGGMGLSGNVGVRYVSRDLNSRGNVILGTVATPTVVTRSDGEWLPSAVAKLSLTDQLVLRLGAAKVVAFPNTEDLNNGVTLANNATFLNGVQITPGTGSGGAPNLNPFRADQFDASVEYYFADESLLSVGVFQKNVSSFIVQRQSPEVYSGVNYLINRKVNGDSAKVRGIEVLAQVPFTFLPSPLDGFGVVATYSYIDSKTPIRDATGATLAFPGLSKNNVNLVGYYEKGPFSARLAYNWRDRYLVGLSAAATGIYNDTYKDLSATLRFDLTENISLSAEANNLFNSRQRTFDGFQEALRTNVVYGRIYKAAVTARF